MIPSEAQLKRLADTLVDALIQKDLVEMKGDAGTLRERFFAVLRQNFQEEDELERDAEKFANSHRRELVGMDRGKIVAMVKERLAKERGFVL